MKTTPVINTGVVLLPAGGWQDDMEVRF